MKESLKKIYEYMDSENELMTCVRLNGEWNEESFCEMRKLAKEVIKDYAKEEGYPKRFIYYFMVIIPSIIDMLSQMKNCIEKNLAKGYTEESYMSMLSKKIKSLDELTLEFRRN